MRLVITTEGEQLRQEFLKQHHMSRLHNPSLDNSIHDFQTHLISPMHGLKSTGKHASLIGRGSEVQRNPLSASGRNIISSEYKSFLQGTNTDTSNKSYGDPLRGAKRGLSMLPSMPVSANVGVIQEIQVAQPRPRLSKEMKQKIEAFKNQSQTPFSIGQSRPAMLKNNVTSKVGTTEEGDFSRLSRSQSPDLNQTMDPK